MRVVGIKTLKNKLSEYVRLAAKGERVLVTDRDRVVAELVPPQTPGTALDADAVLAEAVRAGFVKPPAYPFTDPPPRIGGFRFDDVIASLNDDRADR